MNQTNTLYIVIDPTGAQRGASATVNAINSVTSAAAQLNVTVNQINSTTSSMSSNAVGNFNKVGNAVDSLRGTIHTVMGLLAAVQVGHIFAGFVDEIKKVDREYNGFMAMMNVTTGDIKKSAEAYDNIKNIALAYGVSVESLAKSYAKLHASTKDVLSTKETDRLFESFTATASVLHAEQYTVERMFNAIIQMASKGQVHMEELKQQLGEHLPGALALAAKAMKMDMGTMIEEMKKGNISARDLLVPLPKVLMETFGQAAVISSRSLNAAFMNMRTIWFDAIKDISTSGAGQGMAEVLRAVADHVASTSESFKAFGEVVGAAFLKLAEFIRNITPAQIVAFTQGIMDATQVFIGFIAWTYEAIKTLIEYKAEIILVAELLAIYKVAMLGIATATAVANIAVAAATTTLGRFGAVLGVIGAAVAGWMIGDYFREKFLAVELAGIALARGLTLLPIQIKASFEEMSISVPRFFAEMFQNIVNKINGFIAGVKNLGSDVLKSLGFEGLEKATPIKLNFLGEYNSQLASLHKNTSKEVEKVKAEYDALADYAIQRRNEKPKEQLAVPGYSKKEFDDAQARVAKFLAESDAEFEKHDKNGKGKGSKVKKDSYNDDAGRASSVIMGEYKVFSEQLKTMREDDQITTEQYYAAQLSALTSYSEASIAILKKYAKMTKDPEDRERINTQILKQEQEFQANYTKIVRDHSKEREKYMKAVYQAEVDSGMLKLSKQEEFINKWKDKEGKLMQEAVANGDTDVVDRLLAAFNFKIGEMNKADRITMDKFFATDDEKFMYDLVEKYQQMHDFIMSSTAYTEEEKNALIERLQDDHNNRMRNKQTEMLLNFTGAAGNMVGAFANLAKNMAGESSKAYKVLFGISKAFAIADGMMKVQQAILNAASSAPWPANLAAMASVASAVGGLVNTIASVNFSGAYDEGGSIPAGKWGIAGEYGPEIVNGPANVTSRKDTADLLGNAGAAQSTNLRIVNAFDVSIVGDYIGSDDGEEVIMNVVKRNRNTINQLVSA
jgi:tape measure domain-containing protein